jgi:hypothetical protein
MSLADLKQESAALPPEEQKELAAFLAVLRMQRSGEWEDATAGVEGTDGETRVGPLAAPTLDRILGGQANAWTGGDRPLIESDLSGDWAL